MEEKQIQILENVIKQLLELRKTMGTEEQTEMGEEQSEGEAPPKRMRLLQ